MPTTDATLVAVQLVIDEAVLQSGDSYRAAIDAAAVAALGNAPAGRRLLVFPEVAGHLALYALAPAAARRGKTVAAVLAAAAVRRPLDMLRGAVAARVLDPRHAMLAGLAPDAERYWRAVFAQLARAHGAYVVAGSHLRLAADGALTNASHLIGPDGALIATSDKVNLLVGVEDAAPGGLGLQRGDAAKLPIVDTPLGKLATLIGYDAHRTPRSDEERFVAVVEQLAIRGGCAIVANPTCWRGAAGCGLRAAASDGLRGSLATQAFAEYGVTAHLVGTVLDQQYAGTSEIVTPTGVLARAEPGGHAIAHI